MHNGVDNKFCILVEFVNEESSLAVGYRCWLTDSLSDEQLDNCIEEKEVLQIKWPKCDVTTAAKMKKVLNNLKNKDWENIPARVLAFGEWTAMSNELSALQKFEIQKPSKQDRHTLMKKSLSGEYVTQSTSTSKKSQKKFPAHKRVAAERRTQAIVKEIKSNKKPDLLDDNWSDNSTDESISDDEQPSRKTKSQLQDDVRILTLQKKKLQEDLELYKNYIMTVEFLPNVQKESDEVLSKLKNATDMLSKLNLVCSVCKDVQTSGSLAHKPERTNWKQQGSELSKNNLSLFKETYTMKQKSPQRDMQSARVEFGTKSQNVIKTEVEGNLSSDLVFQQSTDGIDSKYAVENAGELPDGDNCNYDFIEKEEGGLMDYLEKPEENNDSGKKAQIDPNGNIEKDPIENGKVSIDKEKEGFMDYLEKPAEDDSVKKAQIDPNGNIEKDLIENGKVSNEVLAGEAADTIEPKGAESSEPENKTGVTLAKNLDETDKGRI